jgi:hypothetical protein
MNCTSMPSPPGIDLNTPILANESDHIAFGLDDVLQVHRLPDGLSRYLESDVLVNLRPPRLVLMREPDLLRVEGADQPLAFGARLVELGKEDRHVAADDH